MSTEADEIKAEIDLVLYELSQAVLAQKKVEESLDKVAGSVLLLGLQHPNISTPGFLAGQYTVGQDSRSIMAALFNMRQALTLQRDKL